MLRPVMPIWRARGSQPWSVTLRVAPSSAPSAVEQRIERGRSPPAAMPWPTPTTTAASARTSRSSSRARAQHVHAAARGGDHVHRCRCRRGPRVRASGSMPARTVAICTGEVAVDRRDQLAAERRLPRDESAVVDLEVDGVAGEAGAEGRRRARRDLAAPGRARREHGPRRRRRVPTPSATAATSSSARSTSYVATASAPQRAQRDRVEVGRDDRSDRPAQRGQRAGRRRRAAPG